MKSKRLFQLDYLRGLVAVCICLYHITIWKTGNELGSDTLFGKLGVYGVTIFYILSGYTLAFVYQEVDFLSRRQVKLFFMKRFLRIYPLLWFATLATLIITESNYSWLKIFLNVSGLFGLFSWDQYIATGAWSIGNELFFYLFFPLLMWLRSNARKVFYLSGLLFFMGLFYQAFFQLNPIKPLSAQWSMYTSPFVQIMAFYIGIAIQVIRLPQKQYVIIASLLFFLVLFALLPVSGNQIHLVVGWKRIVFVSLCSGFVLFLAHLSVEINYFFHNALNWLGEISYSVYLLHPICFKIWISLFKFTNLPVTYFWSTLLVFIFLSSTIMYHFFEKSFVRLGWYMTKHK